MTRQNEMDAYEQMSASKPPRIPRVSESEAATLVIVGALIAMLCVMAGVALWGLVR